MNRNLKKTSSKKWKEICANNKHIDVNFELISKSLTNNIFPNSFGQNLLERLK